MVSKCGSCGGSTWELAEESPYRSNYKMFFVRCLACKVPVGVVNYYDTYTKIAETENRVKGLESSISSLDYNVRVINENLRRLSRQ